MVSVNIYGFGKSVVIRQEKLSVSIEHIPYALNSDDIRNMTVQSCPSPYYTAVQSVIHAQLVSLTGSVHAGAAAVTKHIFIYRACFAVV